ncbi:hypothetical protein N9955_00830 [bacterium]|nr:hypothetical protein [bacterium]
MEKSNKIEKAESVLLDISRGYSKLVVKDEVFYFKHFTLLDNLSFNEVYESSLRSAVKSGIKTKDQLIQIAIKNKKWTTQKQDLLKGLAWEINALEEAIKKITDYFQKKSVKEKVKEKKEELANLNQELADLCGHSAEDLAETKKVRAVISGSLFFDREFKRPIKDFESIHVSKFFERLGELNDEQNISYAAYKTSFFGIFCLNYRTPHVIFENGSMNMTVFQKNLLSIANALHNRIRNMSIPDNIIEDPIQILNYEEPEKDDGSKVTYGVDDLKEKAKNSDGQLKQEDYLT